MDGNRLLVVDDEPDIGAFIARVAHGCGYEVTVCCERGRPGRSSSPPSAPRHIVLDLMMPGLDGIQALRQLAEARSQAKIVIFSGARPEGRSRPPAASASRAASTSPARDRQAGRPRLELRALLRSIKHDADWLTRDALRRAIDEQRALSRIPAQARSSVLGRSLRASRLCVRWGHPMRGIVPPGAFLPLAEQDALIERAHDLRLRAASSQIADLAAAGFDCPVSINLSARNIRDLDLRTA